MPGHCQTFSDGSMFSESSYMFLLNIHIHLVFSKFQMFCTRWLLSDFRCRGRGQWRSTSHQRPQSLWPRSNTSDTKSQRLRGWNFCERFARCQSQSTEGWNWKNLDGTNFFTWTRWCQHFSFWACWSCNRYPWCCYLVSPGGMGRM